MKRGRRACGADRGREWMAARRGIPGIEKDDQARKPGGLARGFEHHHPLRLCSVLPVYSCFWLRYAR